MGKASSSKKVARAARAGSGRRVNKQRNLAFPAAIVAVVALGLLLVVFARNDSTNVATVKPVANVDHWHTAYGVYDCSSFLAPIAQYEDPGGIHTHGDGVIHVHPFNSGNAGKNATLGKFVSGSGMKLTTSEVKMPKGKDLKTSATKCAGKPATVRVAVWENADTSSTAKPKIYTSDFDKIRFDRDRMAMTIAFAPEGATIPPPPTVKELDQLSDVPGASTTTAPGQTPTSEPTGSTATSAPPSEASSSTTAPTGSSTSSSTP
jgi:hypothetical protein